MWIESLPSAAEGRVAHGPARDLGELQEKLAGYAAQTVEVRVSLRRCPAKRVGVPGHKGQAGQMG